MASHDPVPARRYSEKEIGALLRRAAEIQASDPASRAAAAGLTLRELEEVAAEAGIDAECLRRAAAELEVGRAATLGARLAGAPLGFVLERRVPGELTPESFEALVPLLGQASPGQGSASAVGRTLTYTARSDSNTSSQQVLIAIRDGETMIRVEERLGGLAGAVFGGVLGGVGGGVGFGFGVPLGLALGGAALAAVFPAVVVGGTYAGARALFAAQVRARRRRARELLERLAERVEEEVAPGRGDPTRELPRS